MAASTRRDRWIAWCSGLALIGLHLDGWRPQRPTLWFGWLPEELLYRIVWMLLAWAFLLFLCARIWREEEQAEE